MDEPRAGFIRQQFSGNGLMFLFCANCGRLVAYSARLDVLAIAEKAHRRACHIAHEGETCAPADECDR